MQRSPRKNKTFSTSNKAIQLSMMGAESITCMEHLSRLTSKMLRCLLILLGAMQHLQTFFDCFTSFGPKEASVQWLVQQNPNILIRSLTSSRTCWQCIVSRVACAPLWHSSELHGGAPAASKRCSFAASPALPFRLAAYDWPLARLANCRQPHTLHTHACMHVHTHTYMHMSIHSR